jgi:PrtD family type I secretion system ABC transporter
MKEKNIILESIRTFSRNFWHCIIFTSIINILSLALPIYSMQVLDRVLGSSSIETLIWLSILIFILLIGMHSISSIRSMAFAYIATKIEKKLFSKVFKHNIISSIRSNIGPQYVNDLMTIKSFINGQHLQMIFDIPWVVVFLATIFYIHHIVGFVIIGTITFLIFMVFINYKILQSDSEKLNELNVLSSRKLEGITKNSEVIIGMGMYDEVQMNYNETLKEIEQINSSLKKKAKVINDIIKITRYAMQIMITFTSAILIINGKMSSGGMIAISTLSSKVLAPFDALSGIFSAAVSVKKSYQRLKQCLVNVSFDDNQIQLMMPAPKGRITFENVIYFADNTPIIKGINFDVQTGEVIGIIGKSGSGKTILGRLLAGIYQPTKGRVMIDGISLDLWHESQAGKYNGYLPQNIELFYASIKDNICKFDKSATSEDILLAAQLSGAHDLIVSFANGYDTIITHSNLSGGQKQRIALARAFYKNPKILILDEPNSNLDADGDNALIFAINNMRQYNTTTFIISHKPSILQSVDKIMVIDSGEMKMFDDAKIIIEQLTSRSS